MRPSVVAAQKLSLPGEKRSRSRSRRGLRPQTEPLEARHLLSAMALPMGLRGPDSSVKQSLGPRTHRAKVAIGPVLAINDVTVLYTPSGERTAVLTVTRSGQTFVPVKVRYATQDGTASAGNGQYKQRVGRLDFAAGQTSASIFVTVGDVSSFAQDSADTADFFVNLIRPHDASLSLQDDQGEITVDNTLAADQYRPSIKPINALDQLYSWTQYEGVLGSTAVATVPLQPRAPHPGMPVLAGFDMGPWQYDPYFTEWTEGGTGQSADGNRQASNVYNFSEWQYLDASYYFGGNLLTIPPTVWTNAAHANGVMSLGTIFLSGNGNNFPDALNTPEKLELFAQSAIGIARFFGFDGYLVDNEAFLSSERPTADQTLALLTMLKQDGLNVIWYDAPVSEGFANYFNPEAIPFLQAAGSFQANYDWPNPFASPQLSYQTILDNPNDFPDPLAARDQVFSALYPYAFANGTTLSLWNSTFFSDYNAIIPSQDPNGPPGYYTGLGVYAPDWTIYFGRNGVTDRLPDVMTNQRVDQAFWSGTGQFAVSNGIDPENSLAGTIQYTRTVVTSAPFVTDFNTGEGTFYNFLGSRLASGDWNNLSTQSILPNNRYAYVPTASSTATSTAELQYQDAYIGGSSLQVSADTIKPDTFTRYRLYDTNLPASDLSRVSFTVKAGPDWPRFRFRTVVYTTSGQSGAPEEVHTFLCDQTAAANGWVTLHATIPTTLAGKITGVGFSIRNVSQENAKLDLKIGQMGLFGRSHSQPPKPGLFRFQSGPLLNWAAHFDPTSSYNIYGRLAGKYYLLGTTRGNDYSTEGIILNRDLNGFNGYLVQEVTQAGRFKPVPRFSAADA